VRARWESTQGSDFALTPAGSYLLTRIRLGVAFQPASWLSFYAEGQDARAEFYKVTPTTSVVDPMDFRQGYVEAGNLKGNGVKVRLGRQELTLGTGRLVGTGDWSNVTKTFDIVRGTVTTSQFKLDLLGGSPLLYDVNRMDRHKPGEHFYVAYATFGKLIKDAQIEPYFIVRTGLNAKGKDGVSGHQETLIGGLRLIGRIPGGFDYSGEAARQGGAYGNDTVQAFGYVAGGGWMAPAGPWKLHPNSDFLWASGDDGRKDGHHQSFDFLYGLNQPLNSLAGLYGWRNMEQWRAGADLHPAKKWTVRINFRDVWLATIQDGLYNSSNVRTVFDNKATSNHVGEGVDAQFILNLTRKNTLETGVGSLAPGSYLKQAGKTSGFVYTFFTYTRVI
jgi:hypothetical protein